MAAIMQHIFTLILGITGFIYLLGGLWSWKHPPKQINKSMGYRTTRSMKSQAAWDFAQVYAGKVFFYTGLTLLVLAALCWPLVVTGSLYVAFLPTAPLLAFTALPLYLTERKLKAKFDHTR